MVKISRPIFEGKFISYNHSWKHCDRLFQKIKFNNILKENLFKLSAILNFIMSQTIFYKKRYNKYKLKLKLKSNFQIIKSNVEFNPRKKNHALRIDYETS